MLVACQFHVGFMRVLPPRGIFALFAVFNICAFAFSQYRYELPLVNVLAHARFQISRSTQPPGPRLDRA